MNALIEFLNRWAEHFPAFAWAMFWQSSLLIGVLFCLDLVLRRRIRASVRYALWLVVLVKLVLPPTLASPTNPHWWIRESARPTSKMPAVAYTVTYGDSTPLVASTVFPATLPPPPKPALSRNAWITLSAAAVSMALLSWLGFRWAGVIRKVRMATTSQALETIADHSTILSALPRNVRLKLTADAMSPAVCGLFHPIILLPRSLADSLSPAQLKAVLLHELIHIRRGDIWINCAQALLQIVYWWHPLLWLANARIRRVREEAVDDAVMVALRDEAEVYAPTLLEVAKFAFRRPLASLGLIGILESRSALRQRIERLMDFRAPHRAGITVASLVGILAFTAVAVPMGEGPATDAGPALAATDGRTQKSRTIKIDVAVFKKNLRAEATRMGITSTNPYDGLLEILDAEGVNRGFGINGVIGNITLEGTPEELEVFQQVVEQLNRTDSKPELPLHSSPIRRKSVLITTALYRMGGNDFANLISILPAGTRRSRDVWTLPPDNISNFNAWLKAQGFKPISVPRVQTGHGMEAEICVGRPTNYVEMGCRPFIRKADGVDGAVDLSLWVKTMGEFTADPAGDWPIMEGTNRYAIKSQVSALDHGGVVLRAINPAGGPSNNLVVILNLTIVTNDAIHGKQRLVPISSGTNNPATGTVSGILTDPNFRTVLHALEQRDGVETLAEPEVVTTSGRKINSMDPDAIDKVLVQIKAAQTAGRQPLEHAETVNQGTDAPMQIFKIQEPIAQEKMDELLASAGIAVPPTKVVYEAHTGLLFARGTADQLALVYGVVLRLNHISPTERQINDFVKEAAATSPGNQLETRIFKVDKNTFTTGLYAVGGKPADEVSVTARDFFAKIGVDLTAAGRSIAFNDRMSLLFVKATGGELDVVERTIQALNVIPPQVHMKARFIEVPKKLLASSAFFTNAVAGPMTGIMNDSNFRILLHNLQQHDDVETLAEPEVVTTSGRQTQMRVGDSLSNLPLLAENGKHSSVSPQISTPPPANTPLELSIDLVPRVLADGYTINLTAIPRIGHSAPKTTTVNLWDNQTFVIGDLPNPSADSKNADRQLLVLVTATIIDPAGNRVHTDDASFSLSAQQ